MDKLKPCPCCGELNVKYSFRVAHKFSCQTRGCPLVGVLFTTEQWNNRPAESRIKAEGVRDAVSNLENPDVPLAEVMITNYALLKYADKLEGKS